MMPNRWFAGLDLGQAADYSAITILERVGASAERVYHCRHLQRWPLKTPYPAIVADVAAMMRSDKLRAQGPPAGASDFDRYAASRVVRHAPLRPVLAVDATGVGAPVVDLFKREHIPAQLEAIQITGGDAVSREYGLTRVPKRDLVSAAQVALQTGRLRVAAELAEAEVLQRELQNFQVKINLDTAHDSYGAWREGTHDDLVLAVCIALWIADNGQDRTLYSFTRV